MTICFDQELSEPVYDGPAGCRRCRGMLTPEGRHLRPPERAHRPEPAWETIGFTVRGKAVFSEIPRWHEVQRWCDDGGTW